MPKARVEIIYEDGNILVVNKPTGISATKDRSGEKSILRILQEQLHDPSADLRLVHRLDKPASGVMILAKNITAQRKLTRSFEKRLIGKTYLALVRGAPEGAEGLIQASLSADKKAPQRMVVDPQRGKTAVTQWKLLADFGMAALLAVFPLTGRTHQIRVHLKNIGMPLAVDPLYGSNTALFLSEFKTDYRLGKGQVEKPLIDRLTLHSYQLEFNDIFSGAPDCFVAGLDKKFAAAIKMLAKYNPMGSKAFAHPEFLTDIRAGKKLCINW